MQQENVKWTLMALDKDILWY